MCWKKRGKQMIKPELTARVLFHILLEGHGFVAAAGNMTVNEQRQARGDCFSSLLLHAANNY